MKLVLVASLAAVLGMGMSGSAEAHNYPPPVGGSIYWADNNVVIGLNYGAPYVVPYYAPPRYVYRPRVYRPAYYHGKRHGHHDGYRKVYYKGYRHGYRDDHRGRHGRGYRDDDWDD